MTTLSKRIAMHKKQPGSPLSALPPPPAMRPSSPPPPTVERTTPPGSGITPSKTFSFATEMKFVKELTDIAESLRHVDIPLRRETLRASLQRIQKDYPDVYFPITRDYGTMPQIIRVCVDEGAVFRSKARVPVLICFEVLRPIASPSPEIERLNFSRRRRTSSSLDYVSEEEVENLFDKGAFHRRMNSLESNSRPKSFSGDGTANLQTNRADSTSTQTFDLTAEDGGSPRSDGCGAGSNRSTPRSVSRNILNHGGSSSGSLTTEYANKAEIFKMVLSRRRRAGMVNTGHRRPDSKGGSTTTLNTDFNDGKDEEDNLANLIKQYEESCLLDDSLGNSISPAVETAIEEFKKGNLSHEDLGKIVAKDREFRRNIQENAYLDVQWFVSMAFGESWANKKARVKGASADGGREGWDLLSMIVKSNDDLRQEVCTVQLIELCRDIFADAGLELWLEPYGIISTTSSTGLIETLTDALSLDALKKKDGYVSLSRHFDVSYGHDKSRLTQAKRCFISSLAAYSLVCYLLQIKDRHNGNILLDTEGHLVHIDYGFILGIAPGGSFR